MTRPPTITEQFADYVVGLSYDDLPSSVVDKAKELVVYHLGASLRGHFGPAGRGERSKRSAQVVDMAHELSGSDGVCTIVGEQRRVDPLEAVFTNAFLMNGLDDGLAPVEGGDPNGAGHVGVVVQPVAWATGELVRASGRELITAIVAGYDVLARLSRTISPQRRWKEEVPRRAIDVFGPFGAATAAARLSSLSREQTVHALGHAGQVGMGLEEGTERLWTFKSHAARNGLMAAMLARWGMPATPTIVEGRNGVYRGHYHQDAPQSLEASLGSLGKEFEIANTELKRYWTSSLNFVPIDLTQQLVTDHALSPDRVRALDVTLPREREARESTKALALQEPEPNPLGREGSLRFQLAVVVFDGRHNGARFESPPDANLRAVLDKVRLHFEDGHPTKYARVELTTTEGTRHVTERDRDEPPPLDWEDWLFGGGQTILSDAQMRRLIDLVRDLESSPDVSEIMACMRPDVSS